MEMTVAMKDEFIYSVLKDVLCDDAEREIALLNRGERVVSEPVLLSHTQEKELAHRLLYLPHEALAALAGRYYFGFQAEQTERVFGITNPHGKTLFYTQIMSLFMELNDGCIISEDSMERACNMAMRRYFSDLERRYRPRSYGSRVVLQWAAAVILIFLTAFVTRFSVDAAFRERVVSWVVERFDKYSELRLTDASKTDVSTEALWSDAYVPARFARVEANEAEDVSLYSYATDDGEHMTVIITVADAVFQMDTENKVVRELQINGTQVLLICGDDVNQAVFYHNGHQFDIIGTITSDEMEKITRKILK